MIQQAEADPNLNEGGNQGYSAYYRVNGVINYIPYNEMRQIFYLSCVECKKKVMEEEHGYQCYNCSKHYETAVPNWNFSIKLSDYSDAIWLSVLGEQGDAIMGMQCSEFNQIKDDHEQVKSMLKEMENIKQLSVLIRARIDTYRGASSIEEGPSSNIRYVIARCLPFDNQEHN